MCKSIDHMKLNIKINQTLNVEDLLFYSLILIGWGLVIGPVIAELFFNLSVIFGYVYIKKKKIKLSKKYIIILFCYWIYLIISNLYHVYFSEVPPKILTSFAYIRFILFFLFIKEILFRLNYKKIILYQGLPVLFVALDVIFQKIFNFNIFGLVPTDGRFSSFFGDEYISGSYISKLFFPFIVVLSYYFLKFKFTFEFLLLIFLFSCFVTGERMAFISALLTIPLSFIFFKQKRKILLLILILTIFLSQLVLKNTRFEEISNAFLKKESNSNLILNYKENFLTVLDQSGHLPLFITSHKIWKDNLFIGSGINTFGTYCSYNKYKSQNQYKHGNCSTHPHNYYLEILNETGIVGFIIIFSFIISVITEAINKIFSKNSNSVICKSYLITVLTFLVVISSGSFFNNFISIIFFTIITFLSSLSSKSFISK